MLIAYLFNEFLVLVFKLLFLFPRGELHSLILGSLSPKDLEAINSRNVLVRFRRGHQFREGLEENVGEGASEVSAVYVDEFNSRHVDFFTAGAVNLLFIRMICRTLTREMLRSSDMPTGRTN